MLNVKVKKAVPSITCVTIFITLLFIVQSLLKVAYEYFMPDIIDFCWIDWEGIGSANDEECTGHEFLSVETAHLSALLQYGSQFEA